MKITLKCGITKRIKNPQKRAGQHCEISNAAEIDQRLDELDNLIEGSCGVSDWSVYADINVRTNRED